MEEVESKVSQNCKCSEFEKRIVELELDVEKRKVEHQELEIKFMELKFEKNGLENEVKGLRAKKAEVKKVDGVANLTGEEAEEEEEEEEEEDEETLLKMENVTLRCEKENAENEVEVWKKKYQELELRFLELDNMVSKGRGQGVEQVIGEIDGDDVGPSCNTPGTPFSDIASYLAMVRKRGVYLDSVGDCCGKRLSFKEDRSPGKKMAPPTPGNIDLAGRNVINICDSGDENDMIGIQEAASGGQGNGKACIMTDHTSGGTLDSKDHKISQSILKGAVCNQSCEEDMDAYNGNAPSVSTPKRKRASNIITSDTEIDEEDDVPISRLKKVHLQESISKKESYHNASPIIDDRTLSRRHLMTLRQFVEKGKTGRSSSSKTSETNYQRGIPTTDEAEDYEPEEVGSDSEDSFIDDSAIASDPDDASSPSEDESNGGDASNQTEDESDGDAISSQKDEVDDNVASRLREYESDDNMSMNDIISRLRRRRDRKCKWEFEADMLADFGKDAELCMKAVCALYRQQTEEEKNSKGTFHLNGRGFSKLDAPRGSRLAEFLTDGDPFGDLRKSEEQLQEYNYKGIELCRTLATHYSKQLFEIYKNKEDTLFLPDQANQ